MKGEIAVISKWTVFVHKELQKFLGENPRFELLDTLRLAREAISVVVCYVPNRGSESWSKYCGPEWGRSAMMAQQGDASFNHAMASAVRAKAVIEGPFKNGHAVVVYVECFNKAGRCRSFVFRIEAGRLDQMNQF